MFIIPREPSRAARQGQDAVPWVSRLGVTGHSQHLGVSLCDTRWVGHVGHMTKVCVVTSLPVLGARLPLWRGWHRSPLPGTAPVPCAGTGRGHSSCVTRVARRLVREPCIGRVALEGFGPFPSRDDSLRWLRGPLPATNLSEIREKIDAACGELGSAGRWKGR